MVYYLQRIDERSCLMVQENQQQARLQEPVLVILQRLCMRHGSTFEGEEQQLHAIWIFIRRCRFCYRRFTAMYYFRQKQCAIPIVSGSITVQ